jgi:uncharacterized protein (DUF697 family)
MTKIHDETASTIAQQQTTLLDTLSLRLKQTQSELNQKNAMIHHKEANNIVHNHVLTSAAVGIVPLPVFDIIALSGTQLNMLRHLSQHYNVAFDKRKVRSLMLALLSGSLPVITMMGASSLSKLIPGVGTFGGNVGVSLLGGSVTYATGQTFIKHFNAGGHLTDFEPKQFTHFFQQELKKGKKLLLRQSA